MHIKSLQLNNFRNYEKAEFHFSPGINFIFGENAQGKTNLLEAVYLLSTGRSFRTTHLSEAIQEGKKAFYLEADFEKDGITQSVSIGYDGTRRIIKINETKHPFFSALLGLLPTVLYAPTDIDLIIGSPAERRRFLDLHIAQFDPFYIHHITRYYKAMKQRREILRTKADSSLDAWEEMMAISATYIIEKREKTLIDLKEPIALSVATLSGRGDELSLLYQSPLRTKKERALQDYLQEQFKHHRTKDTQYQTTLFGPHRDDILLSINGQSAKIFCSEGEKRSCIAAMRFAEWKRLQEQIGTSPIMSIDDFGVHLDNNRLERLQDLLGGFGQIFLTAPHLPEKIARDPSQITLHHIQKALTCSM